MHTYITPENHASKLRKRHLDDRAFGISQGLDVGEPPVELTAESGTGTGLHTLHGLSTDWIPMIYCYRGPVPI